MTKSFSVFACTLCLVLILFEDAPLPAVPVMSGESAPGFTLQQAGEKGERSLSSYRGQYVVLNFWTTWCPPCQEELPELISFYETKRTDVELLAVNVTEQEHSVEDVVRFSKANQLPFPVLLDQTGDVQRSYRVAGIPVTIIVGPDGEIVNRWSGPLSKEQLADLIPD